jgi:hypothetical protein
MSETDQPTAESNVEAGYRAMAQDEAREAQALELAEATIEDVSDEAR